MKLYINLATQQLIQAPGVNSPISSITVKRGDLPTFELYFYEDGNEPTTLAANSSIAFAAKEVADYDGALVAFCDAWTAPGAGEYAYTAAPNFNTTEINALLGVGGTPEDDEASSTLMAEISWTHGLHMATTQTFKLVVVNDVYRGNETLPVAAAPEYPAPNAIVTKSDIGVIVAPAGSGSGSGVELHPRAFGSAYPLIYDQSVYQFARSAKALIAIGGSGNCLRSFDDESFGLALPSGSAYYRVAAIGLKVVVLGYGVQAYSADGGETWTTAADESIPAPSNSRDQLAVNAAGMFVVATGSSILYSTELGVWVSVTHNLTDIRCCAFFDGYWWFACGDSNVYRTAGFTSWESYDLSAYNNPASSARSIATDGNRLVLVGYGPRVLYIDAGATTWGATLVADAEDSIALYAVRYINGYFWFIGSGKFLARSSTCASIEVIPWGEPGGSKYGRGGDAPTGYDICKTATGWGYLVAGDFGIQLVPVHPALVPRSQEPRDVAINLPVRETTVSSAMNARAIDYDANTGAYLLAGGDANSAGVLYESTDLRTWSSKPAPSSTVYDLSSVHGGYIYAACDGQICTRTYESSSWDAIVTDIGKVMYAVKAVRTHPYADLNNSRTASWVAVGQAGTVYVSPTYGNSNYDQLVDVGTTGDLFTVAYGNGRWIIGGTSTNGGCFIAISCDLYTWKVVSPAPCSSPCWKIDYDSHFGFVAQVGSGPYLYQSFDGLSWTKLNCNNPPQNSIYAKSFAVKDGLVYWNSNGILFALNQRIQNAFLLGPTISSIYDNTTVKMLVRNGNIITTGLDGFNARVLVHYAATVDPAQVGTFGTALAAYTANNQSAALATYTSDPESTEYTEATVANLNALRVAYENLRVVCEADRVRFAAVLAAYENLRASHEDLRAKLIAAGVVS